MTSMQTDAMTHIVIAKYPLRSRETSHQTGSPTTPASTRRQRDRGERADALNGEEHHEVGAEADERLLADGDQARVPASRFHMLAMMSSWKKSTSRLVVLE